MNNLIYLDQNILSDLRPRKLDESDNTTLKQLYNYLKEEDTYILYSHITLNEIGQIGKKKYKDEYIDLLDTLNAIYIEPQVDSPTYTLNYNPPSSIWKSFIENDIDNDSMGINTVESEFEKLCKKVFGVKTNDTFNDLNNSLVDATNAMLTDSLDDLKEGLPDEDFQLLKSEISSIQENLSHLEPFNIPEEAPLGPDAIRRVISDKGIELYKLPPKEVIPKIQQLIFPKDEQKAGWIKYAGDDFQHKLSSCYLLMNLAGYFPDDFTKKKKRGDRYRASMNDMQHVRVAADCQFLISNDRKFRKKASACYAYLNVLTEVVTPEEFVERLQIKRKS